MEARHAAPSASALTANERLKRRSGRAFWGAQIAAVALHVAVFALWPTMTAAELSASTDPIDVTALPPEIPPPPAEDEIVRPAEPVVGDITVDPDVTIADNVFVDQARENLAPPTRAESDDLGRGPVFTPMTVRPSLRNQTDVERALQRNYPSMLRDAGIGGTVNVWFFIDEQGRVVRTQVAQSSGYEALDEAALEVAEVMEFSPALNRETRVPVWVSIPIVFSVR